MYTYYLNFIDEETESLSNLPAVTHAVSVISCHWAPEYPLMLSLKECSHQVATSVGVLLA